MPTVAQQFLAAADTSTVARFSPPITINQKAHEDYDGDQAHSTEDAAQNRTKCMTVAHVLRIVVRKVLRRVRCGRKCCGNGVRCGGLDQKPGLYRRSRRDF